MYLAYIDDAGDPGLQSSPTDHLVLGAILVHESKWLDALDGLIALRRQFYQRYRLDVDARLRARDFARGSGPFRGLEVGARTRLRMLNDAFRTIRDQLPIKVFAVAIAKAKAVEKGWSSEEAAWTFTLQRLQRFAEEKTEHVMVLTEAELQPKAKRLIRQMRRHHRVPFHRGDGNRRVDIRRIVEDPLLAPEDGFWWQLADWTAHAALRSVHVEPQHQTQHLWDLMGEKRLQEVSRLAGGPPGIVVYS